MEEKTLSEQKQKGKEEPLNSKAKPINYEKEFNELLELVADLGLQIQNVARNTKIRIQQEKNPNQIQS